MVTVRILFLLLIFYVKHVFPHTSHPVNEKSKEADNCVRIDNCQYASDLLKEGKNPKTCGFEKNVPLVSCPFKGLSTTPECLSYYTEKVGEPKPLTLPRGDNIYAKEFPHMAAIGFGEEEEDMAWLCSGTLISNFFVLSGAHCTHSQAHGLAKWIRLGDLNLIKTTDDAKPQDFKISQIYIHPLFNRTTRYHDIALFKLDKEVVFDGQYYQPACLETGKNISDRQLATLGWNNEDLFHYSVLTKTKIQLVHHETCTKAYMSRGILKNGIMDEYQICVGDFYEAKGCLSDSGGPLQYVVDDLQKKLRYNVVVGIKSFNTACNNLLSVYTRVSAYTDWIENIVAGNKISK